MAFVHRLFDFTLQFCQCLAANASIEKIGSLGKRRCRQPGRHIKHAVFDLSVLRNKNRQCALRLKAHEFNMLEPNVVLCGEYDASRTR